MDNVVFLQLVQVHIECLKLLIHTEMLAKGLKESECQKICLMNRLFDFETTANAVVPDDMKHLTKS